MAATGGQDTQDIAAINPVVDIDDTGVINQPQDTPDLNTLRLVRPWAFKLIQRSNVWIQLVNFLPSRAAIMIWRTAY